MTTVGEWTLLESDHCWRVTTVGEWTLLESGHCGKSTCRRVRVGERCVTCECMCTVQESPYLGLGRVFNLRMRVCSSITLSV